jgi:glycosyltransferase domain-containing protein
MTIVVPTKNRPHYVDRLLSYYLNMDFVGIIIIIDSSDTKISNYISERINNINKSNYIYTHLIGLPTMVIKDNLNLIKTKYVSFLGDDDYIVPDAILRSISFLESNPHIAGCRGDGIIVSDPDISSDPIRMYRQVNRLEESSSNRLSQFFLNYGAPFFHVCRSDIFKKGFSLAPSTVEINQGYDRLIGDELIASGAMLAYGKFAAIDGLHLIRTNNIERIELRNSWYYEKSDFYEKGRRVAIDDFTKKISTIISEQDSIALSEAEKVVLKVHQSNVFSKEYDGQLVVNIKKFIKPLMLYLNIWKFMPVYLGKYSEFKRIISFIDKKDRVTLKDLLSPGNRYHKDFIPVYASLIGHNSQEIQPGTKKKDSISNI